LIRTGILLSMLALSYVHTAQGQSLNANAAVKAWTSVRGWIDEGTIPGHGHATPRGVDGAAVQLTWHGQLVGGDEAHAAAGDVDPLAKAARGALLDALAHRHIAALPEDERVEALGGLLLEVEVTGLPEPLVGPLNAIEFDMHPGQDGLAVRRNDQWSMRFPSRLRTRGRAATPETLRGMLLMLGVHEAEADALRRTGEVTIYRLPTINLRQAIDGRFPEHFARGRSGSMQSISNVDGAEQLADRLASKLLDWYVVLNPNDTKAEAFFAGTWDPNLNAWAELIASDSDVALASLALARWASMRPEHAQATRAIDIARIGLQHVAQATPVDRRALAVAMVAAAEPSLAPGVPSIEQSQPIKRAIEEAAQGGDEPTRSIATLAMVLQGNQAIGHASIEAWVNAGLDTIAQTMPWSLAVARAIDDAHMNPNIDLLREILLKRQLDDKGAPWGLEAAGAVAIHHTPAAMGIPSLRAGWALAALVADEPAQARALLQERMWLLATHLQRRTIGVETAAYWATPDRAIDCIRLAPWDERLSISAQALALLTALDITEALNTNETTQERDP
jgi:hypothetical protein